MLRAVAHVNQAICSPQDEGGRSMRSAKDRPNQACCFRLYNYCEGELPLTAYICILPPVFERHLNTYLTVVFPMVVVLGLRIFQSRGLRICSSLGRRSLTLFGSAPSEEILTSSVHTCGQARWGKGRWVCLFLLRLAKLSEAHQACLPLLRQDKYTGQLMTLDYR